jgi:hypothetical protein
LAAPRRLVDKSPSTVLHLERLHRLRRAFPDAFYLHLLRHPRSQGESLWRLRGERAAEELNAMDHGSDPPVVDLQLAWYRMHLNIVSFLDGVGEDQWLRLRGEDLLADLDNELPRVAKWLGIAAGTAAVDAMKHPERSPFAGFGPPNARLGNDPDFLRDPVLRESKHRSEPSLDGPVPWRTDGEGLSSEVVALAHAFGYR